MRFSERHGFRPVRDSIQLESMDDALRNSLWSILSKLIWDTARRDRMYARATLADNHQLKQLSVALWFDYFKLPVDQLPSNWDKVLNQLREYYFSAEWYEVYDFIEFVLQHYGGPQPKQRMLAECNAVLERELSAYRFVGNVIAPLTNQAELDEIGMALDQSQGPVQAHLKRALDLMADRKSPDFRNSVKESISAVESLVALTVGERGTLGQLIKKLESEIGLHRALSTGFSNLYGYTSDEGGIRHAMMEAENVSFVDAKFFLVICSSFINFVSAKLKT